jgi:two-component system response regulator FixJ
MTDQLTVFVIDSDGATRDAVCRLAHTMNLQCEVYASGAEFLESDYLARPGCVILEMRIPDTNGLALQEELARSEATLPVVFLTAHGTVSIAVRAMRAGAVHFLEKPLREHELWDAIQDAVALDQRRRQLSQRQRQCRKRLAELDPKEVRILEMIAEGQSKRAIAAEMQVCVRTVELRRNQIMKKLKFESIVELVHFALTAAEQNGRSQGRDPQAAAIPML